MHDAEERTSRARPSCPPTPSRRTALALVAPLVAALAACGDHEPAEPAALDREAETDEVGTARPPTAEPEARRYDTVSDEELTQAIEREFLLDGAIPRDVEVSSSYGVVTLAGTVDNLLAAERAKRIAEVVRGVKVVDDDLVVEVEPIDDHELKLDVARALLDDPVADRYELDVSVDDGRVTLRGEVQSYAELTHSERVTKGVRGVASVANELVIEYPEHRADPEIQRDVEARLRWDALVEHVLLDVDVDDAEVSLTGTVGSAAERRRAIDDAWVAGVEHVDGSGIEVSSWVLDDHLRTTESPLVADEDIADAIRLAAAYDPQVLSFEIDPEVRGGVVTLRGRVDRAKAKLAAEEIAENTVGVVSVDNQIEVDPARGVPDLDTERRIEAALRLDPITDGLEIHVTARGGRVTLTGEVDSVAELAQASEIALGTVGVWKVDNELEVDRPTPFVRDPYLYPYHPYVLSWSWPGAKAQLVDDVELSERIRRELRWSPRVDESDVTVIVSAGTAQLLGTVDSWREYRAAEDNAFEGGAIAVDNDLRVETRR